MGQHLCVIIEGACRRISMIIAASDTCSPSYWTPLFVERFIQVSGCLMTSCSMDCAPADPRERLLTEDASRPETLPRQPAIQHTCPRCHPPENWAESAGLVM